jgi:hypothetical protein
MVGANRFPAIDDMSTTPTGAALQGIERCAHQSARPFGVDLSHHIKIGVLACFESADRKIAALMTRASICPNLSSVVLI